MTQPIDRVAPSPDVPPSTPLVHRRTVLAVAASAGVLAFAGGAAVLVAPDALAADGGGDRFLRLSEFLTGGEPLDAVLAARYHAALARRDPQFEAAWSAVARSVADSHAAGVEELMARPDLDAAVRKTVSRIVSAWYLGIVGDGADTELIAYAEALMYRPTRGVLVIPTYGGGPDTWGPNPAPASAGDAIEAVPTGKKQA